ncbi:MAG: NAD(P)H-dependent oxidoreductase subunit E [Candidatus Izimaplasma sp.]|nr:NAD(P)H-dependent oxidoreductase subunit E [Candidatus Izimaplasma bacterium]
METNSIITPELHKELLSEIKRNLKHPGPLMPILHEAQRIFNGVPLEVQKIIAKETGISIAKINGVVTFYSSFTIDPKGDHVLGVCLGTACYVKGAEDILDGIQKELQIEAGETTEDRFYTLESKRCIGTCMMAPVMTIDDDVHGYLKTKEAVDLIKEFKENK